MVTTNKARILESFQARKLTGNNGNVRCNGMKKDGLVARGPRALGTRMLYKGWERVSLDGRFYR